MLRLAPRLARLLTQPLDRFISARFSDPRLRQLLGYPAVFLGSSPAMTPSLYHLMSHLDLENGVWYPQGGFGGLIGTIARLAEERGVEIRTDCPVTTILTDGAVRHPRATGVEYGDRGVRSILRADVVVSTADLHHTETALLPERLRSHRQSWWSRRIAGPGAVLVMLGVRGPLSQLSHHNLFFTEDWDDGFARIFGAGASIGSPTPLYVCRTSATDPGAAPPGHENLFVFVPTPADPGIGAGDADGRGDAAVESIADDAIRQISEWAEIPDLAERVVVRRTIGPSDFATDLNAWRGGALGPAHTLRQSAFLRGSNASRKVEGLYYAGGTTVPGIGLPMCLISAELVLKRLRSDTTSTPLSEPIRARTREPR
jgi:phytoene desaturase